MKIFKRGLGNNKSIEVIHFDKFNLLDGSKHMYGEFLKNNNNLIEFSVTVCELEDMGLHGSCH